ncbi:proline iminopeptidase-family hydrolase [Acidocella sp.]|uniref:proline iminopeptidase-family hydrolase n=1 Tax=Acidocella sp. TaxID=50710 RepID=UPI002636474B|nr:proline iminopeptidase-family hydrolase [Acidocella sp.]
MPYRQPDETIRVPVHGHEVVAYSFGSGPEVLFCLNGGPGLPCDYVRDSHSFLAENGYRVVAFDQLGCGASDRPTDPRLWTLDRYVEEVETVRTRLNLGIVHLLGQSWGTWLGIEYALTYPEAFKTITLANGAANIPHLITELERLRYALGHETVAMMQRHEAEGTTDHPEYQGAIAVLNYRHVCRLQDWPEAVKASLDDWNQGPYNAIQGPNEFCYTGSIKDWNRVPDLHRLTQPALVMCGLHDELTPACSRLIHQNLPQSRIKVFQNSSHMPFWEEPEEYQKTLRAFLDAHRG